MVNRLAEQAAPYSYRCTYYCCTYYCCTYYCCTYTYRYTCTYTSYTYTEQAAPLMTRLLPCVT